MKPTAECFAQQNNALSQPTESQGPDYGDGPDFAGWEERAGLPTVTATPQHPDDAAVDRFAAVMKANDDLTAERDRLRTLLRETAAVAITMLYHSHTADVLAEFRITELEAVVKASESLRDMPVESVYRSAWDASIGSGE